jgi:hypothetical protein
MNMERPMNDNLKAFCRGFVHGARETPRAFFSPLITLFRWMDRVSKEGMAPPLSTYTLSPVAKKSLETSAKRLGLAPAVALELAIHQLHAHGGEVTRRG